MCNFLKKDLDAVSSAPANSYGKTNRQVEMNWIYAQKYQISKDAVDRFCSLK
jgi:hypothetical protein